MLKGARAALQSKGRLILSFENGAHALNRLALLRGDLPAPVGDDDSRPARLLTLSCVEEWLEDAGFALGDIDREESENAPWQEESGGEAVPDELRAKWTEDADLRTRRFTLVAYALPREELQWWQERLRSLAEQLEEARCRIAELTRSSDRQEETALDSLAANLDRVMAQRDDLRRRLLEAHDNLMRRDDEIRQLRLELASKPETDRPEDLETVSSTELDEYRARVDHLQREVEAKNQLVTQLADVELKNQQLANLVIELEGFRTTIDLKDRQISELQARLQAIHDGMFGRTYRLVRAVLTLGRRS
jgi:hypothetical protein